MHLKPELYVPTKKEWGYKPPHHVDQTWYYDCVCNDGWTMNMAFRFRASKCNAICEIADPNGKLYGKLIRYNPDAIKVSTESLDIQMGDQHTWGEYPTYYVKYKSDEVGLDLVYELQCQEFREPPDGTYLGRSFGPTTPVFCTYFIRPRCKINGYLMVGDKKIPIKNGIGYCDNQTENAPFPEGLMYYYYFGKVHGPKHTIFYWDTQLAESCGYQRMKWLWVWKDNKLVQYENQAKMYVETLDYTDVDQSTGLAFPKVVNIILDDPIVKGTLTHKMKYNYCDLFPRNWGPINLHRHVSDVHHDLEINGEKIECDTVEIHELAIPNPSFTLS